VQCAQTLEEIIPVSEGGLLLLGSAAQGAYSVILGSGGAVVKPAEERAKAAEEACARLVEYLGRRKDVHTHQVAWTLVQKTVARSLDYDMRMCPEEALAGVRGRVVAAARSVVDILAPKLDEDAWGQMGLPGMFGGCSLRLPSAVMSNASYWGAWAAHNADVKLAASRLGRPRQCEVDEVDALCAAEKLREAGVLVSMTDGLRWTATRRRSTSTAPGRRTAGRTSSCSSRRRPRPARRWSSRALWRRTM